VSLLSFARSRGGEKEAELGAKRDEVATEEGSEEAVNLTDEERLGERELSGT